MTVERKDQALQQMESLSLRLTRYSKHRKVRKFPYRNPGPCAVSQNLSEMFLGMKSCNIFLLLLVCFNRREMKAQISPVHYSSVLEKFTAKQVHRMKNLTRRDGRIQGIREKGSVQQKVSVGEEWHYRKPLRRQGTFYEN